MAEPQFADRMEGLGTESAFEVLAKAKEIERTGKSVIHLEIGEPDFDTPPHIKEAGIKALRDGYTHYTPAAGLLEAREAIAEFVSKTRGFPVDPSEVVITPGSKPIMLYAILAMVSPGDEVIYPDPGYPIYESLARFAGGVARPLALREARGFRIDPDELRRLITPRTKLLILNSPHNPCGSALTREDVEAIADVVLSSKCLVLADEIYWQILYEGSHISVGSLPGMKARTILLDGFSKAYAMTGWRLGFGVMPASVAAKMTQLMINSNSCAASFTQIAGIAALRGPQEPVRQMVAEFRRRRDVVVEGLNGIDGVSCKMPEGAFYVFPNTSKIDSDSRRLADFLLNDAGVAVLSGVAFGAHGQGYLRLSYATSVENIREGLRRIRDALKQYRAAVR